MRAATLKPFLSENLDVLFVGKNPSETSSRHGHYFSTKPQLWDQLFESGLITHPVDMMSADEIVFGSNKINCDGWRYGITDLVPEWAESHSRRVPITDEHCRRLTSTIQQCMPRAVVLMHHDVRRSIATHLNAQVSREYGRVGRWLTGSDSEFFCVPFPHGSRYSKQMIVDVYSQLGSYLSTSDR